MAESFEIIRKIEMNKLLLQTQEAGLLCSVSKKDVDTNGWIILTSRDEINYEYLVLVNPSHIFFAHWSWIVPEEHTTSLYSFSYCTTSVW